MKLSRRIAIVLGSAVAVALVPVSAMASVNVGNHSKIQVQPNVSSTYYSNQDSTAYTSKTTSAGVGASGATLSVGDLAVRTTDGIWSHPIYPFHSGVYFDSPIITASAQTNNAYTQQWYVEDTDTSPPSGLSYGWVDLYWGNSNYNSAAIGYGLNKVNYTMTPFTGQ